MYDKCKVKVKIPVKDTNKFVLNKIEMQRTVPADADRYFGCIYIVSTIITIQTLKTVKFCKLSQVDALEPLA